MINSYHFNNLSNYDTILNINQMEPQKVTHPQKETAVYFWGFLEKEKKQFIPKLVPELNKAKITKVTSGGFFLLAANDDGQAWGWGSCKYARFGIPGDQKFNVPRPLGLKFLVKDIAAGNWHSLMTDHDGNLYGSGHNKYGCLGLGTFDNVQNFTKVPIPFKVVEISAGDGFSMIISESMELFGCGHHNFHGSSAKQNQKFFKRIGGQTKFKKVSCGFTHTLAICETGSVYSWGQGNFYQLGHGNKHDVKKPHKIQAISEIKMIDVSCTRGQKYSHSMAVSEQGLVYTWGAGYKGKLGHHDEWSHADAADQPLPRQMKTIDFKVKKAFGGGIHSGILDQQGNIYTFGCGSDGRLGHPQSTDHRYLYREGIPRKIQALENIECISACFSYYQNICVGYRK